MTANNDRGAGRNQIPPALSGESIIRAAVVIVAIVSYSLHSILTEGAKSSGALSFDVAAVVAASELVKLLVTFFFLAREGEKEVRSAVKGLSDFAEQGKAAVPALLYAFNNQLAFFMLLQMDPGTMQLLSNFKIIPTVVLSVIMLGRKIEAVQYKALGLLFLGTVALHGGADGSIKVGSTYLGLFQAAIYCVVSGMAGVWCEKVLREGSLHVQNMHLYIWGCIVNTAWLLLHFKHDSISGLASPWAIANILNQALTGLLISVVLKYAGNVDKIFIVAASVMPAGLAAYFLFGYDVTVQWLLSATIIVVATWMYATKTDLTLKHAILLVGIASAVIVLSQIHDEYAQMKMIGTVETDALDDGSANIHLETPTPDQRFVADASNNGLIRLEVPTSNQKFFPFHAADDKHCVTKEEILDISQAIRNMINNDIRVFPRNGFLLGIIRHGGFLPQEHADADLGVVSSDLDRYRKAPKTAFHAAGCAFKLKKTEDYWVNWRGLDPVNGRPYDFFGVNVHCGEFNMHANAVYPYRDTGVFFYPFLSVNRFNHNASIAESLRYNTEGADVILVDTDERLNAKNYREGAQLGNTFGRLDCFTERQFYFTTIPVPCDYEPILTSLYGRNWNHVESRGNIGQFKETRETKFESHAVSDEENDKLLMGGPRPICMS